MDKIIMYVIEFVVAAVLSYIFQKIFVVDKYKKDLEKNKINKDNKRSKTPQELVLFLNMTGLKEKDIDVFRTLKLLIIVNSIDIGIIILLTNITRSIILKLLIAVIAVLFVLIISYRLLAFIYKKKENKKNV